MDFWLIRHGATSGPEGVAIGWSDPPLSPEGRAQAKSLAQQLAGRQLAAVYSSDSQRALDTAAEIAALHDLEVHVDRRLRELNFGAWEGRNLADLWLAEPEAAAGWEADLAATPASFGESVAELQARVADFLAEGRLDIGGEIAIVAHRGSLAALRTLLSGEPLAETLRNGLALGATEWLALGLGSGSQHADRAQDL